jgi:cytochrome c oxidase subunit 4
MEEETMEKKNHTPFSTYIMIWFGLVMLTGITVTVAMLKLGSLSIFGAIAIATVKSTLVVLFFMHIKYEDKVFKAMLWLAIVVLAVIMLLTFADTVYR